MDQNMTPNAAMPGMEPKSSFKSKFKPTKNQVVVGAAVLVILVIGVLAYSKTVVENPFSFLNLGSFQSGDAIAKNAVAYLNKSVLQQGQTAELVSSSEVSGVIKMQLKIGGSNYDSYATKDGKLLFPEAFTLSGTATPTPSTPSTTGSITPTNVVKVASTMLDAYVVSSCPFGIQIQRALSEAIKTAPGLAQYVKVRYIGAVSGNTITAMHGVEEAQENLRQICIRDEQPAKYWAYVDCYIQKAAGTAANGMPYGDSKTCQASTGIDSAKLNACVADPARGLKDAKADFDLNTKYNVSGSPTLILNGAVINETEFGGRSADAMRNIICSSSKTAPAFCSTKLNTTPATTSFSVSYAGSGAAATSNNNCAPTGA